VWINIGIDYCRLTCGGDAMHKKAQ